MLRISTRLKYLAYITWAAILCGLMITSCSDKPDPKHADKILQKAIEQHGGAVYRNSNTTFKFRGTRYTRYYKNGIFQYSRSFKDSLGNDIYQAINNDSTWQTVNKKYRTLTDSASLTIYESINSVIYFGFLPFKLNDTAVKAEWFGKETIEGAPYHEIEVTFDKQGGGIDHQDRFTYWVHQQNYTLDYLAYYYETDGGGERFRAAYNRRSINGLIIQDYKNYKIEPGSLITRSTIQRFDSLYQAGRLTMVSTVELENVTVKPL